MKFLILILVLFICPCVAQITDSIILLGRIDYNFCKTYGVRKIKHKIYYYPRINYSWLNLFPRDYQLYPDDESKELRRSGRYYSLEYMSQLPTEYYKPERLFHRKYNSGGQLTGGFRSSYEYDSNGRLNHINYYYNRDSSISGIDKYYYTSGKLDSMVSQFGEMKKYYYNSPFIFGYVVPYRGKVKNSVEYQISLNRRSFSISYSENDQIYEKEIFKLKLGRAAANYRNPEPPSEIKYTQLNDSTFQCMCYCDDGTPLPDFYSPVSSPSHPLKNFTWPNVRRKYIIARCREKGKTKFEYIFEDDILVKSTSFYGGQRSIVEFYGKDDESGAEYKRLEYQEGRLFCKSYLESEFVRSTNGQNKTFETTTTFDRRGKVILKMMDELKVGETGTKYRVQTCFDGNGKLLSCPVEEMRGCGTH